MKKNILSILLALALLALPGTALAGFTFDEIVFGDNYTLPAGDTLRGNLVVFGGNVVIEESAEVTGSIVVFGGSVDIAGQVGENVATFGGSVNLRSTATVEGELTTIGGSTSREEGAQVKGGEGQGFDANGRVSPRLPTPLRPFEPLFSLFAMIFNVVMSSIGMGLVSLLVMLFWPEQTARVSAAATSAPAAAGALGLLTAVAAPALIVALAITLCLLPFSFVGLLIFIAAAIFGWLALGAVIGARLSAALRLYNLSPAVSAAIGTTLFSLVANIIWQIPCVGWVMPTLLGLIGLGAVTLTRFGTQPYLPGQPPSPAPSVPSVPGAGEPMASV